MIFCTAGHVDHGKTALVRALTGVDTDRLAEERRRGLTIELGFAPLELPGVGRVSLVDVPGHAQFIPTMLSGCGGLDGALFTVAADEGPMPQTAEHLDILSLLGLERGVVALTRADLASPAARAEVEARTRALTAGTFLEGAPRIFVSAVTGEGLEALRAALAAMARQAPPPPEGSPRLHVDRVFSVDGSGTVVTGTLTGGPLRRAASFCRAFRIDKTFVLLFWRAPWYHYGLWILCLLLWKMIGSGTWRRWRCACGRGRSTRWSGRRRPWARAAGCARPSRTTP